MAIAERSALSTDFPLRAERYPSASLCLVFDPAKASLTDAVDEAASPHFSRVQSPAAAMVGRRDKAAMLYEEADVVSE